MSGKVHYIYLSIDVVDLSQTYLVVEEVQLTCKKKQSDDEIQVDECEHYAYVYTPLACPFAKQ